MNGICYFLPLAVHNRNMFMLEQQEAKQCIDHIRRGKKAQKISHLSY